MADLCTTIYKIDPTDNEKVIKEEQQIIQTSCDLKMLERELMNMQAQKRKIETDIVFLQAEITEVKKILNIK